MKKKLVALLLAAFMAVGLVACGGNNGGVDGTENAGGTVSSIPDNVLALNIGSEPDHLDPALNSSVDGGCLAVNSFAGLYTYDKDGKVIPQLAAAMPEVSEDGTVYTVKMIESKWSNGDAVTAHDFVYSWNRAYDPATAADYAYLFEVIAKDENGKLDVVATDDYTLVITLTNPCPYFNDLMAFPTFMPVHQASVEASNPDGTTPGAWAHEAGFVCNGAYTLKEWKHNESMIYVKNPNYYDAANVTMDELRFMLSADDTTIYAAYNGGNLDYIDTVPNDEIASLQNNPEFGVLDQLGIYYIGFNVNDPIFDGKTVEQAAAMRQAISLLIDRTFIAENVGQTGQLPADSFVPIGTADGNGGTFKTETTGSSYYDAAATGQGKVEEAIKLFESAGYTFTDKGDGSYQINPALSMTYLTNTATNHETVAQAVQQDLAIVGIDMKIAKEDWNVFLDNRKEGNFTIAREGWVADFNDPINFLEIFISESGNNDMQLGKGDSAAAPKWDAYDALLDEIRTTTDFEKRVDLMHQAEDMLMDTWAVIPIYYYNDPYMQKSNVSNIYATVFGMKYFMYAEKN